MTNRLRSTLAAQPLHPGPHRSRGSARRPLALLAAAALCMSVGASAAAGPSSSTAKPVSTVVAGHETLWGATPSAAIRTANDSRDVELGTRFIARTDGWIKGLRYYKSPRDTGTHDGTLWSGRGEKLATAQFENETRSGWQTVVFSKPVKVTAKQPYVVSYSSNGHYTYTHNFRGTSTSTSLSVSPRGSGVFTYSESSAFPTSSYRSSQYWVDPLFTTQKPSPSVGVRPSPRPPAPAETTAPSEAPSETTSPSPTPTAEASPTPTAPAPSPTPATPSASPTPPAPAPSPTPTAAAPSPTPSPSSSPTAPQGTFPDAGSTGVPAGTELTPYTGPSRITTPGTVIDSQIITTPIVITAGAHDVTIKNSVIRASAFFLVLNDEGARNLQIIDTELDGQGHTGNDAAVGGRNYTLTRVNIHGTMDGLKVGDNVTVQDSYIHDLVTTRDSHNDGIQSLGSTNLVIQRNTILVPSGSTSAIILSTGSASAMRDILIDGNLLGGGAYTVYGGYQAGVDPLSKVSDITISNNRITTTINARGGVYGPFASADKPAVTLQGNVWHDGPNAGRPI